jgi:hypothetical protein
LIGHKRLESGLSAPKLVGKMIHQRKLGSDELNILIPSLHIL